MSSVPKLQKTNKIEKNRMDWYTKSKPLLKDFNANECRKFFRNLNGLDSFELKQNSYKCFFT